MRFLLRFDGLEWSLTLILLFSMLDAQAQKKVDVPILMDKDTVYLSASLFWRSFEAGKKVPVKSKELQIVSRYIDIARNDGDPTGLLYKHDGSIADFQGFDEFYRSITGVRYQFEVFWGGYVYVALEYMLGSKGELFPWREDLYCGSSCYISLDAGLNESNQIFELIYASFLNDFSNGQGVAVADSFKLQGMATIDKTILPFVLVEKKIADDRYPIVFHLRMRWLDKDICWQGCKGKAKPSDPVTIPIASFLSYIHEDQGVERVLQDVLSTERNLDVNSSVAMLAEQNDAVVRVYIDLEQYIEYIKEWEDLRLIGYVADKDNFYVFFRYRLAGSDRDGRFGSFLVGRDSGRILFSPVSSFSYELLYSPEVLSMVKDLWDRKKKRETKSSRSRK